MIPTRKRAGVPLLALLAVLAGVPRVHAMADVSFEDQVNEAAPRYTARAEAPDAKKATLDGHISQVNQMLMQLVPDDRKTVADWFIVGNMLFRADIAASDQAMKKAEALRPDEPAILLERAMAEQRARHCAAAIGYYDRFHATEAGRNQFVSWAYETQCHLALGDADKALADWTQSSYARRHIAVEEAMYEVFSTKDSNVAREALLAAVHRPDAGCELMELDSHWEVNWWNQRKRSDYLERDAATLRTLLAADAPALAEFELCHDAASLSDDDVVQRLVAARVWGPGATLPRSPRLAYMAVRALVHTKTATPADVLKAWEAPLNARLAARPDDLVTLDLLAFLYAQVKDAPHLKDIDRQGWKRLHQRRYAESWLTGRELAGEPIDTELADAFAEFPDSALVANLRLHHKLPGVDAKRAVTDYGAAAFANVAQPFPWNATLDRVMAGIAAESLKP